LKKYTVLFFVLWVVMVFAQQAPPKEIVLHENKWTSVSLPSKTSFPVVKLSLSFNDDGLFINADVKDKHFKDGDRSWRYGDGFYINFVMPEPNERKSSGNFYGFGFSLENGNPVSVLVNKNGKYFPNIEVPPSPKIKIDSVKMTAHYSISLPWKNIYSFHPLKDQRAGINIIYISQNDDGSRIIQQLVEDNYDTETTNERKFLPLKFNSSGVNNFSLTGEINRRAVESNTVPIKLWVRTNKKAKQNITIQVSSDKGNPIKKTIKKKLTPGVNKFNYSLKLPKKNGLYNISVSLNKDAVWKETVYKYDLDAFSQSLKIISLLTDSTKNAELHACGNILKYHIKEPKSSINKIGESDQIDLFQQNFETLSLLIDTFVNQKTLFKNPGHLLSAFKSSIDSNLRPFSIILPENFDISLPHTLFIVLHGSGVDEIESIKSAAKDFGNNNFIFIAPRGRNLSSWYGGDSETDFLDMLKEVRRVFNIDKTVIYGFSMGGYGVWRFALKYPELFDAGVVVSGTPFNPHDEKPENDMNTFFNTTKKIPFLVLHGTADRSLDISYTDKFVEKLKSKGFVVDYTRVEGGGHDNFSSKKFVADWLLKMNFPISF
jgi:predicted esterase